MVRFRAEAGKVVAHRDARSRDDLAKDRYRLGTVPARDDSSRLRTLARMLRE